jgi:hypothetical protein
MPWRLLVRRRLISGRWRLCAWFLICCGFCLMSSIYKLQGFLSLGGICLGSKYLLVLQWAWSTRYLGGFDVELVSLVGKTQLEMFLSMSSGGLMSRSDSLLLLQASIIVTIAETSLPLLSSSPQERRLTAWWCRFMCILFKVWLLHLSSMCGALSDPLHKQGAGGKICHVA